MQLNESSSASIRSLVTMVFGALPATLLSIPATLGVVVGLYFMFGGLVAVEIESLIIGAVMFVWGGLGLYGMLSLWAVSTCPAPPRWVKAGLAMGTIAIIPVWPLFVAEGFDVRSADILGAMLLALPPVVALGWLIEFARRPSFYDEEDRFWPQAGKTEGVAE